MIFKTLLGVKSGPDSLPKDQKKGIHLAEQISLEFNEKQGGFLFDGRTGKSWTLNPSGALILEGLINGEPEQSIVNQLRDRFEVSPSRAFTDIRAFRSTLLREGHLSDHE